MLTWEEDVQAHALYRQGWSISAIARHSGQANPVALGKSRYRSSRAAVVTPGGTVQVLSLPG